MCGIVGCTPCGNAWKYAHSARKIRALRSLCADTRALRALRKCINCARKRPYCASAVRGHTLAVRGVTRITRSLCAESRASHAHCARKSANFPGNLQFMWTTGLDYWTTGLLDSPKRTRWVVRFCGGLGENIYIYIYTYIYITHITKTSMHSWSQHAFLGVSFGLPRLRYIAYII